MFVIMVYDAGERRNSKVLKVGRKYLHWVQNSVFEGELTEANYHKLKEEVRRKVDNEEDSVIFYKFRTMKYTEREVIGKNVDPNNFIL
ncbi:MAG TPA: CRISPR-associated endonuclease Cas2 [Hungateiclostridium thermocellum]|jgi:CRISPR-associated protein Cas2|uniref:CRISPR-associated endoribonuclease Cas2 n=2 Tax=Acetivibrio thermocellus TaxID=1515 RepID=A3DHR9_ACET2|nr:CRISPR-associated endonuclease Cas2 [Acetivibrio thermocellus]CDG36816.1 CRISPR-associated Cas2 family protein [Acetivibrio thermocellus BC1]ABN53498.1 CRISPR-associated protein Cas2 [Acetivibrio thermocellus ATCC 27405]ADU75947.1 CRISPR-associated protein Cas2 [Acetivibrio thermocellus DSM 1313]ALX09982.1 CRISPR associated protein Cas2 [Acetivibrio thermocellus AD2]ANV77756.1 CRISPR associated protein Cas2 [Acetivibrio thermocellus DSM 2360]